MPLFARLLIKQWLCIKTDQTPDNRGFFIFCFYLNLHHQACTMNIEKENFLRTKFIAHLQQLKAEEPQRWGKMNVHQMIEHFTDAVMSASGKLKLPVVTPPDKLERLREFLLSEKPFKENTRNPIMSEEPVPIRKHTKEAAIGKLKEELIYFFDVFEKNPGKKTTNPIFGELNFEQNVQLLYKHAVHHLKQFGVTIQ